MRRWVEYAVAEACWAAATALCLSSSIQPAMAGNALAETFELLTPGALLFVEWRAA